MRAIYLDSSILVALLLREPGFSKYEALLEKWKAVYSSYLLEAEVYATAARESVAFNAAEGFIQAVSLVIPDRSLKEEYLRIFHMGFCRGADAHHVATALYLDPTAKNLTFVTADKDQARVAKAVGFRLG